MFSLSRDNRLIFLCLLAWGAGDGLYINIRTLYIESLGANSTQIGTVLSLGGLAITLSVVAGGYLADRFSHRKLLILGNLLGTVSILSYALARGWAGLIPGTILLSLSAFVGPSLNAYVARAGGEEDVAHNFVVVFAGYSLGTMLTPPLGGWLSAEWGMRVLFCGACFLFALSTLPLLKLAEHPTISSTSASPSYLSTLSDRPFLSALATFLFLAFALSLGPVFSPNYLKDVVGLDVFFINTLGTAASLGTFVLSLAFGRLSRRWGLRWTITAAQGIAFLSLLLFLLVRSVPLLAIAYFLRGGFGVVGPLSNAYMARLLPKERWGRGFGLFATTWNLAATLAPYLAGWLYAFRPSFPFLAALILIAAGMGLSAARIR